jgi:hypothetical protein
MNTDWDSEVIEAILLAVEADALHAIGEESSANHGVRRALA